MRTKKKDKTLPTYWQIIEAARELFAEHGFRDTTIRMISQKAKVNGASVNYYFRSKEALYEAIFNEAFNKMGKPLNGIVASVKDQDSWEKAMDAWVAFMLDLFLKDEPEMALIRRLVARERSAPTQFCNSLFEEFFFPVVDVCRKLVRMAAPESSPEEFQSIYVSVLSQTTCFMYRDPPWDSILICNTISRKDWIALMHKQIMANVLARLSFKRADVY